MKLARPLRLITYLAPGLPLELFAGVAHHLSEALDLHTELATDPTRSAPDADDDPFTRDEADVGFLCAPGYLWLAERTPPAVELVPAAFAFDDPRCRGRAVYFAELVVAPHVAASSLAGLCGARWVYNDVHSLSGYFSVLDALAALGHDEQFFGAVRAVGSHHAAIEVVASGEADCAAIDSNTLRLERKRGTLPALRRIQSLGPYPVQPVVARAGLSEELRRRIASALLSMHESVPGRACLAASSVRRFAPVTPADYEPERRLLRCAALAR